MRDLPTHVKPINVTPDENQRYPIVYGTVTCCRDWEVDMMNPIGNCKLCGQRPTTIKF